jgi:excisionase family DNA binding protein
MSQHIEEMNKEQARTYLGVSLRTLQRLTIRTGNDKGVIPCHSKKGVKGNETWYLRSDLDAYLAQTRRAVSLMPAVTPDATNDTSLVAPSVNGDSLAILREMLAQAVTASRPLQEPYYLSSTEAAHVVGVSVARIRQAIHDGDLKAHKGIGRGLGKIFRADLEAWARGL